MYSWSYWVKWWEGFCLLVRGQPFDGRCALLAGTSPSNNFYLLGYLFGYLMGTVIHLTYNLTCDVRFLANANWSICLLDYFFGCIMGMGVDDTSQLTYNLADMRGKI